MNRIIDFALGRGSASPSRRGLLKSAATLGATITLMGTNATASQETAMTAEQAVEVADGKIVSGKEHFFDLYAWDRFWS